MATLTLAVCRQESDTPKVSHHAAVRAIRVVLTPALLRALYLWMQPPRMHSLFLKPAVDLRLPPTVSVAEEFGNGGEAGSVGVGGVDHSHRNGGF